MPPRFAYWTIILDGTPTSFRTKEREEILPLFNQLHAKNPAAQLKWFSGGTLWDSREQAREARELEKVRRFREERDREAKGRREGAEDPLAEFRRQHGRPPDGSDQRVPEPSDRSAGTDAPPRPRGDRPQGERRGKDWRPGGEHRDPRDKYKLPPGEARKRWKERNLGPRGPKPFGSTSGSGRPSGDSPRGDRPYGGKPFGSKPGGGDRPFSDRPRGDRPYDGKPFSSKPGGDRPFGDRPRGDRPYGGKPFGSKPGGDRPFGDRPRGPKPFGGKPGTGGPRPFAKKPFGGRPRGPKPPGGPRGKR
jgi:hypothetical protein